MASAAVAGVWRVRAVPPVVLAVARLIARAPMAALLGAAALVWLAGAWTSPAVAPGASGVVVMTAADGSQGGQETQDGSPPSANKAEDKKPASSAPKKDDKKDEAGNADGHGKAQGNDKEGGSGNSNKKEEKKDDKKDPETTSAAGEGRAHGRETGSGGSSGDAGHNDNQGATADAAGDQQRQPEGDGSGPARGETRTASNATREGHSTGPDDEETGGARPRTGPTGTDTAGAGDSGTSTRTADRETNCGSDASCGASDKPSDAEARTASDTADRQTDEGAACQAGGGGDTCGNKGGNNSGAETAAARGTGGSRDGTAGTGTDTCDNCEPATPATPASFVSNGSTNTHTGGGTDARPAETDERAPEIHTFAASATDQEATGQERTGAAARAPPKLETISSKNPDANAHLTPAQRLDAAEQVEAADLAAHPPAKNPATTTTAPEPETPTTAPTITRTMANEEAVRRGNADTARRAPEVAGAVAATRSASDGRPEDTDGGDPEMGEAGWLELTTARAETSERVYNETLDAPGPDGKPRTQEEARAAAKAAADGVTLEGLAANGQAEGAGAAAYGQALQSGGTSADAAEASRRAEGEVARRLFDGDRPPAAPGSHAATGRCGNVGGFAGCGGQATNADGTTTAGGCGQLGGGTCDFSVSGQDERVEGGLQGGTEGHVSGELRGPGGSGADRGSDSGPDAELNLERNEETGEANLRHGGNGQVTDRFGRQSKTNNGGAVRQGTDPAVSPVITGGGTGELRNGQGDVYGVQGSGPDGMGGTSTFTDRNPITGAPGVVRPEGTGPWNFTTREGDLFSGRGGNEVTATTRGADGSPARLKCGDGDCHVQFGEGHRGGTPNGTVDAASQTPGGQRADIRATGSGSYTEDPTKRGVTNVDQQGDVHLTGSVDGWGGGNECTGSCLITRPDGSVVVAPSGVRYQDQADDFPIRVYEPVRVQDRFATGPDDGGDLTISNVWHPDGVTVSSPQGQQAYRPTFGGGGGVFLDYADTRGSGGAGCLYGSGGRCTGSSADGKHTVDSEGQGPPSEGTLLGFDGGWSAADPGATGTPGEQQPWRDLTPSQLGVLDPGYRRPPVLSGEATALHPDAYKPTMPLLSEAERLALPENERRAYDQSLPAPTPANTMRGGLAFLGAQVDNQAGGQQLAPRLPRLDQAIAAAEADGTTPAERAELVDAITDLDNAYPGGYKGWQQARDLLAAVDRASYLPGDHTDAPQIGPATDPRVIAALVDGYDPTREATPQERERAQGRLGELQADLAAKQRDLANYAPTPDEAELPALFDDIERRIKAFNANPGTERQADALNAELDGLRERQRQAYDRYHQLMRDQVAARDRLSTVDTRLAQESGDPRFGADITAAADRMSRAQRLLADVRMPESRAEVGYQEALAQTAGLAELNYASIEDGPRGLTNQLGEARLPSTMYPDIQLAQTAAARLPDFAEYHGLLDNGREAPIYGGAPTDRAGGADGAWRPAPGDLTTRVWDQLSPDEQAKIAALRTPEQFEASVLSTPEGVIWAKAGSPEAARAAGDSLFWTDDGSPWMAGLSPEQREQVRAATAMSGEEAVDRMVELGPRGTAERVGAIGDAIGGAIKWLNQDHLGVAIRGAPVLADAREAVGYGPAHSEPPEAIDRIQNGAVDFVTGVPEMAVHLVQAAGTELYNAGAFVTMNKFADGGSLGEVPTGDGRFVERSPRANALDEIARTNPFTGGIIQTANRSWDRWQDALLNEDWSKVRHDYWTGTDPHTGQPVNPVMTFYEDLTIPALVGGGAGFAAGKLGSGARVAADVELVRAQRAQVSGNLGRRDAALASAARLNGLAARSERFAGAVMVPLDVQMAPFRAWGHATGLSRLLPQRAAIGPARATEPLAPDRPAGPAARAIDDAAPALTEAGQRLLDEAFRRRAAEARAALRPERPSTVERPLIDRIDEVTEPGPSGVSVAALAEHLNVKPRKVVNALARAPERAPGQPRYRIERDPETGAEHVTRPKGEAPGWARGPEDAPNPALDAGPPKRDGASTPPTRTADTPRPSRLGRMAQRAKTWAAGGVAVLAIGLRLLNPVAPEAPPIKSAEVGIAKNVDSGAPADGSIRFDAPERGPELPKSERAPPPERSVPDRSPAGPGLGDRLVPLVNMTTAVASAQLGAAASTAWQGFSDVVAKVSDASANPTFQASPAATWWASPYLLGNWNPVNRRIEFEFAGEHRASWGEGVVFTDKTRLDNIAFSHHHAAGPVRHSFLRPAGVSGLRWNWMSDQGRRAKWREVFEAKRRDFDNRLGEEERSAAGRYAELADLASSHLERADELNRQADALAAQLPAPGRYPSREWQRRHAENRSRVAALRAEAERERSVADEIWQHLEERRKRTPDDVLAAQERAYLGTAEAFERAADQVYAALPAPGRYPSKEWRRQHAENRAQVDALLAEAVRAHNAAAQARYWRERLDPITGVARVQDGDRRQGPDVPGRPRNDGVPPASSARSGGNTGASEGQSGTASGMPGGTADNRPGSRTRPAADEAATGTVLAKPGRGPPPSRGAPDSTEKQVAASGRMAADQNRSSDWLVDTRGAARSSRIVLIGAIAIGTAMALMNGARPFDTVLGAALAALVVITATHVAAPAAPASSDMAAARIPARAGRRPLRKALLTGVAAVALTLAPATAFAPAANAAPIASTTTFHNVAAQTAAEPTELLIRPGDTFDTLAERLGVQPNVLALANPQIRDRDKITAGHTLALPASWTGGYALGDGEGLWHVAERFGIRDANGGNDWRQLAERNAQAIAGRPLTKLQTGLPVNVAAPTAPPVVTAPTPQAPAPGTPAPQPPASVTPAPQPPATVIPPAQPPAAPHGPPPAWLGWAARVAGVVAGALGLAALGRWLTKRGWLGTAGRGVVKGARFGAKAGGKIGRAFGKAGSAVGRPFGKAGRAVGNAGQAVRGAIARGARATGNAIRNQAGAAWHGTKAFFGAIRNQTGVTWRGTKSFLGAVRNRAGAVWGGTKALFGVLRFQATYFRVAAVSLANGTWQSARTWWRVHRELATRQQALARLAAAAKAAEGQAGRARSGPDRDATRAAADEARAALDAARKAAEAKVNEVRTNAAKGNKTSPSKANANQGNAGKDSPKKPTRAARALDRSARGRGLAGWRARLVEALGLRKALSPRTRKFTVRAAVGLGGIGVGLAVLGDGAPLTWVGAGLAVAAGVLAVRAVWSPRQARAPPPQVLVETFQALWRNGSARLDALFAVVSASAWAAPVLWNALSTWITGLAALPNHVATTAVLASLATGVLVWRYVLRRQLSNQLKGMQTRPWLAAWRSAALVVVITATYRIATAFAHDAQALSWLLGSIAVATPVVAVVNALVQDKDIGRTRVIKALIAGGTALSTALGTVLLLSQINPSAPFAAWLVGALISGVLVSGNTPIADYIAAAIGKHRLKIAQRKLDELTRQTGADETKIARLIHKLGHAWLDYQSFSKVDTRVLLRKAIDTVLNAIFTFMILNPWAVTDSPAEIALRAAVVAVLLWLTGKIRDRDEYRAKDEPRDNVYGYQSSRELRDPNRPSPLRGNRLDRRVGSYRAALAELLDEFGLGGRKLDRALAEELAGLLFAEVTGEIPGRADDWAPIADAVDDALTAEREAQRRRQNQHRVAAAHTLLVLAANPAALARVAFGLREKNGRAAEVLEFQLLLGERLARLALENSVTLPDGTPLLPKDASRTGDWAIRLAEQIKLRQRLRQDHLSGPLQALLEAIAAHYEHIGQPDHPDAVRARLQLIRLEYDLIREGLRKPPADPLDQVREFHQQRRSSAADAVAVERAALDNNEGDAARLATHHRLALGHGLMRAAAGLVAEAEYHHLERAAQRERWHQAIGRANEGHRPNTRPTTLLEILLLSAGRNAPVTAQQLADEFGGSPATWQRKLAALRSLKAVDGGHRARLELVRLWREASPQLRRALRANPTALPGGHPLEPLTRARLSDPADHAYPALLALLREANLTFRRPSDGPTDDAVITWRRMAGRIYLMRNPEGGLDWPARAGNPVTREAARAWARARVPAQQRRLLAARVRAVHVANRQLHQALLMATDLRDSGAPEAVIYQLVSNAMARQLAAFVRLAEARTEAVAALDRVRAYPHQTKRTLRATDRMLGRAPAADPVPEPAEQWLREVTRDLHAVRRALQRRVTEERLAQARTLLERHDQDRAYAWSRKLWRTISGARAMENARLAAEDLERRFPAVRSFQPPPVEPGQIPIVTDRDVVPQPGTPGLPDATRAAPGGLTAVTTLRGPGNRTNQDAGTTLTLADGTHGLIVADGLSRTPRSERAAYVAVTAARRELERTEHSGQNHRQAVLNAYRAAAEAVKESYASDHPHRPVDVTPYATTLLIAVVGSDGRITVGWVGDSRAYLVSPTEQRPLTDDHTRAGIMTHWLSPDHRPALQVRTTRGNGPGLVLATTDGLHSHMPEAAKLWQTLNGETDPVTVSRLLVTAARAAGGNDDATVAVGPVTRPDQVP